MPECERVVAFGGEVVAQLEGGVGSLHVLSVRAVAGRGVVRGKWP